MSGDLDLEQRYRRVLRLLPGYYRDKWEQDMVAAFLDSWMTGDPDEDSVTMEYDRPTRQEIASVIALAARLYLGGSATPRRYFAWGQAVRLAVLAVVLVHATQGLSLLTLLAWRRHLAGWFPALPASLAGPVPGGAWPTVMNVVDCVWIMIFVALVLGYYRMARVVAALAIAADLVFLPQAQFAGMLAAGLMLTVAGCGHLTPLGPDAAATAPPPSHLRSPLVLQAMRVQPPAPAGGCPARFTMISVPGNPASAPVRSVPG